MNSIRLRAFIAMLLMVASATAGQVWKPTHYMADSRPKLNLEELFPKQFADWRLDRHVPLQVVSPVTEALLNKLYNQTLSRTYVNSKGDRIMLSIAYGGDQSEATRAHRPEVCYPAQGFDVLSSEVAQVTTASHPVRVKRLVAKLDARIEPITYWIVVGDSIALSGTEQKWEQVRYSFSGVIPDGMLVRVSNIDPNKSEAFAVQDEFVADMVAALPPQSRSRVIGTAGT
jgi:EpsI family protein